MVSIKKQILIIEDDQKLANLLSEYLQKNNYQAQIACDYQEAKDILIKGKIDFIILDIMLPTTSGFNICKKIRETSQIPILFLSARGEITDKVVGLELGADDYMSKPFEPRELLARVEAILRRQKIEDFSEFHLRDLKINWEKKEVFLKNHSVILTYLEYQLLSLLAKNKGSILDRDMIVNNLYGLEWNGMNRAVDVLLGRLRKKINDNQKKPIIRTVWGRGYVLE